MFEVIWDWSGWVEEAYAGCCWARAVVKAEVDRRAERSGVVCFVMVWGRSNV